MQYAVVYFPHGATIDPEAIGPFRSRGAAEKAVAAIDQVDDERHDGDPGLAATIVTLTSTTEALERIAP